MASFLLNLPDDLLASVRYCAVRDGVTVSDFLRSWATTGVMAPPRAYYPAQSGVTLSGYNPLVRCS